MFRVINHDLHITMFMFAGCDPILYDSSLHLLGCVCVGGGAGMNDRSVQAGPGSLEGGRKCRCNCQPISGLSYQTVKGASLKSSFPALDTQDFERQCNFSK